MLYTFRTELVGKNRIIFHSDSHFSYHKLFYVETNNSGTSIYMLEGHCLSLSCDLPKVSRS